MTRNRSATRLLLATRSSTAPTRQNAALNNRSSVTAGEAFMATHLKQETPPGGGVSEERSSSEALLALGSGARGGLGRRRLLRNLLARVGGGRGRRGLRAVLAVRGLVALGAFRLVL